MTRVPGSPTRVSTMKLLRVILTALGYLVALAAAGFIEMSSIKWVSENLSLGQFLVLAATLIFAFCMVPVAKHYTDNGERWPWEPKQ